jgi:hypothetical protein
MTFTYKLSRRLALTHISSMLALLGILAACNSSDLTETSYSAVNSPQPQLEADSKDFRGKDRWKVRSITISPDPANVPPGETRRFSAKGVLSNGTTVDVPVAWRATGGKIDANGLYTAGSSTGTYQVVARLPETTLVDSAGVSVGTSSPTLIEIRLSPASISLQTGATENFSATAKFSDGTTGPANVTYQATGGRITSDGHYTAGQTAGIFQVIATQSEGTMADTAIVTVSAPPAPPAPSTGTTYELATGETPGSINPFEYTTADVTPPFASADRARNGSRSWKFESAGVVGTDGSTHAQFLDTSPTSAMPGGTGFQAGWYSFYLYVDAGYDERDWNMLLGWMTSNSNGGTVAPIDHIGLEIHYGTLQLVYVNKSCSIGLYSCPNITGYSQSTGWYLMTGSSPAGIVAFPRNQWVHIAVYKNFQATNGEIEVWQDGVKIMDLTHPNLNVWAGASGANLLKNLGNNMVLQFGMYHGGRTKTQRIYVDDFRVSDYRPMP